MYCTTYSEMYPIMGPFSSSLGNKGYALRHRTYHGFLWQFDICQRDKIRFYYCASTKSHSLVSSALRRLARPFRYSSLFLHCFHITHITLFLFHFLY